MNKKTFYQLDSTGDVRVWTIEVNALPDGTAEILTHAGKEGMKMTPTSTIIYKGLGKKTVFEQAVADAETEINKKKKKGMVEDRNNLKAKTDTATIKAPMKAETYHPTGYLKDGTMKKGAYTLDGKVGSKKAEVIRGQEAYVERKFDGWRFRVRVNRTEVVFYTSSGDITLSFPQIEKRIRQVFDKNIDYWNKKYGVEEYILDGEIFNLALGFQLSASACGSTVNITPEKQALRDQMQFHIFDVAIEDENVLLETRKKIAEYFVDNINVMHVESIKITLTEANIEKYMAQFLAEGHEGLMIRIPQTPYEFKRSKFIFKYKPLMDDEFKVVGLEKSITGETLGSMICEMPDGRTFRANPMADFGTDAKKLEIWNNQSDYIGKWVTVVFLEYTTDGKPRHGRVKGFRKGKSKD